MSTSTLSGLSGTSTRLHVGLNSSNLERSVGFYRVLLGTEPARILDDYARFELDSPALVLALYPNPQEPGGALNHVGLRLPDSEALVAVQRRLEQHGIATQRQDGVECCYARQTKFWATDPDRVLWEIYTLHEDLDHSGFDDPPAPEEVGAQQVWEHRIMEPWPDRIAAEAGSLDEVRLEGAFNTPASPEQLRALAAEAYRALRPGGRIAVHALVGDRPFPGEPRLPGMAALVQQVPVHTEPLETLRAAGFGGLLYEKLGDIHCFTVNGVELREMRLIGWKPGNTTPSQTTVVYKGPHARVTDESGIVYVRNQPVMVNDALAELLRHGLAAAQFAFLKESAPVSCCGPDATSSPPLPPVSKCGEAQDRKALAPRPRLYRSRRPVRGKGGAMAISRRVFLGAAGTALASGTVTTRDAWAKSPERLRHLLSNETYSLRDEIGAGRLSLLTAAEFYKNTLGIRGISLNDMYFASWEPSYLDQIRESIRANDRVVTCLIMEGNLATADAAKRKQQIAGNMVRLKAAGYLGAPVVRMNLGGVGPGEDDGKEGVDRCIAAFKEMLPLAQDLGIRITIENHGGVSGTVERILAVIHGTDPKWVGSLLDFGNPPVSHQPEVFEKLAPYAYHTHAKLAGFKPDGEASNSDYGALLEILKRTKYRGSVSVEWDGAGEAIDGIKRTRDLIRKHWPELPG